MTEERRDWMAERELRRTAEGLVCELQESPALGSWECVVSHEDAGGQCEREGVMEVYGLVFCEVHGREARAAALEELYFDAEEFLGRLDNPTVRNLNGETFRLIRAAIGE